MGDARKRQARRLGARLDELSLQLFVVADAAVEVSHFRDEAYLGHWRLVGTGLGNM
jgi:hypothetical protein